MVPPPTPVTAAKKAKVTMSCLRWAAAMAPVAPNTATAAEGADRHYEEGAMLHPTLDKNVGLELRRVLFPA